MQFLGGRLPVVGACLFIWLPAWAQTSVSATAADVLGPEDQVSIRVLQAPEMFPAPVRVDGEGNLEIPLVGRIHAGGLTPSQFRAALVEKLEAYVRNPEVVVQVEDIRSQPVSVIGAVNTPGVQQLRGTKSLVEVLSAAGGPRPDAGPTVKITRRARWGRLPLDGAAEDSSGAFSTGQVNLKALIESRAPEANIPVMPNDVISVPRAEMVYVVGEVEKAGAFVLNERETISAVQALSLAGGFRRAASPQAARILRATGKGPERTEMAVDLKKILSGKASDVPLQPNDILFVPGSNAKKASLRAVEAAISVGTGVVVWRR